MSILTKLSFLPRLYYLDIDIFDTLIQLTDIYQSDDITYLHASQWKQLIQDYFPQLNKFYLTYYNKINNDSHQDEICSKVLNEFCSSFWIEKNGQWMWK